MIAHRLSALQNKKASHQANPLCVLYTTALFEEWSMKNRAKGSTHHAEAELRHVTVSFATVRFKQYNYDRLGVFVEVNDVETQNIISHREDGASMD